MHVRIHRLQGLQDGGFGTELRFVHFKTAAHSVKLSGGLGEPSLLFAGPTIGGMEHGSFSEAPNVLNFSILDRVLVTAVIQSSGDLVRDA